MSKFICSDKESRKRVLRSWQLLAPAVCFLWSGVSFSQDEIKSVPSQPKQAIQAETPESTEQKSCCPPEKKAQKEGGKVAATLTMKIPDVELLDQEGKKVRFYSDLVKDKVVAINFIFTTCTTICPPLSVNFSKVQNLMGNRTGRDFHLISISVDPVNDTPQRLRAWGEKFGAKPGWTFLTGKKQDVDKLLKALKVFTPIKEDHSPLVLVGNEAKGQWTRINGLVPSAQLVQVIEDMLDNPKKELSGEKDRARKDKREPVAGSDAMRLAGEVQQNAAMQGRNPAAQKYFSDVELINQYGEKMRFYSDLIKGKVVIINCFFTECTGICPVMGKNLLAIQEAVGERLGKDVHIISISVDSITDTPQRLKQYAENYHAKPGWYFLSGKKENVDQALYKLGFFVEERDQHSGLFLIGNDATGLWKKAMGLAKAQELIPMVEGVLNDGIN
ncbi:MAG: Cytochrome oxidase biogenesis protein Sco1/SenC/PrrC, putative copper metallochaperone [Candidatus Jettenia ecosi]|uniref:Cytochrome oxidase biogenesis protein Sco1/SenC/PrrC, putative copper metallochaperone n=1 Tax=Candidatus Jettenia ecosi TaxID=2494326 RepID=A0A533QBF8_9BACT|nr:MAG: Cytochrome oxidase biogenesis protein Sco1/SenC/PrrC, putative copper metallochaperone [Candidatus Jettenia ecosi]